jgi:plastocyanin
VHYNSRSRLGAALVVLAACALARPAGAGVSVDLEVSDKIDGKYGNKVEVDPGDKVYFRMTDKNNFNVPLVCVCEIPMLKWQGKEVLLPGKQDAKLFAATCPQAGTYKLMACMTYVDPKNGHVSEEADTVTIEVADEDDTDGDLSGGDIGPVDTGELGGGQQGSSQQGGGKGGQQQTGGQQQGGSQQQGGQQQSGGQQQGGNQQQSGGQQQGGYDTGGQQNGGQKGLLGQVFSLLGLGGQQSGGDKGHGEDHGKKGDSGSKGQGHGKKGKGGD